MENSLGMSVELRDLGLDPNYPDGDVQLPPVILASLGNDPNKKTVRCFWKSSICCSISALEIGCNAF